MMKPTKKKLHSTSKILIPSATAIGSSDETWKMRSSWKVCNRTATSRRLWKSLSRGLLCNSFFLSQRGQHLLSPFFMTSPVHAVSATPKLEKTSKQKWHFVLHFHHFCLLVWEEASEASQPQGRPASKLEKTSKLLIRWMKN